MSEATDKPRQHPDLFTPEQAAHYLCLDSTRGLDTLRRDFGLAAYTGVNKGYLYWREDLDNVALKIVGRTPGQSKAMRLAR